MLRYTTPGQETERVILTTPEPAQGSTCYIRLFYVYGILDFK